MKDGFRVIDADRHVLEPSDLFDRYLPERFRGRVRIEGPNQSRRFVDGERISDADRLRGQGQGTEDFGFTFAGSKRWRDTFADALSAGFDPASNVRDMDREGVDPSYLEHVGADSLTTATDYPHVDAVGKFPDLTVGALSGNAKLSTDARRKVLWDNPVRLFGLKV